MSTIQEVYIYQRMMENGIDCIQVVPSQAIGYNNAQEAVILNDPVNDSYPDNATLIQWHDDYIASQTTMDNNSTARQTIRTLALTAVNYTQEIALVFASVKQSQFNSLSRDATFTAITSALNDVSIGNGFRNVVTAAYNAHGITVNLASIGGESDSQKERFNAFCDYFFTSWAFMAFIGTNFG